MSGYPAGSVIAKIELDTSDFDSKIQGLQEKVSSLKSQLNNTGTKDVTKQLNEVQKQLKSATDKITVLETKCKDYKKQLSSLREGNKSLTNEITKNNNALKKEQTTLDNLNKSVNKTVKSHKSNADVVKTENKTITDNIKKVNEEVKANEKLNQSLKKTSNQLKKLRMSNAGVNNRGTLSDRVTTFKELQQHIKSTKQVANEEKKTSEVIADSTKKNIQNKAKEAQEIKKYTEWEIKFMQNANSTFKYRNSQWEQLYPIDSYKNWGGRKSEYFRNYSSLLRSFKNWNADLLVDTHDTEGFQKRMKELMKDLGVDVSDIVNGKHKGVIDKSTGKKVEYLDTSKLKDNSKWLRKVQGQLWELKHFQENLSLPRSMYYRGNYSDMWAKDIKKEMDFRSRYDYGEYGKEGNPFIKDYIKQNKILKKAYNQAQNSDYYSYLTPKLERATKAWNTFERGLKTTAIDWNKINNSAKQFKQYSNNWELTTKQINRARQALFQFDMQNKGLLGRHKTSAGKELEEIRKAREAEGKIHRAITNKDVPYNGGSLNKASVQLETLPKIEQASFEAGKKILQEYLKVWAEAPITVKRSATEIENAILKFASISKKVVPSTMTGKFRLNPFEDYISTNQIANATQGYQSLERRLKSTEISVAGFSKIYSELGTAMGSGNHYIQNTLNSFKNLGNGVDIQKAKLKAFADQTKATFETMQVELAKANAATYKYWKQVRGTADVKGYNQLGTLDTGINQYYGQIDKINAKLAEFKVQQQSVNNNVNQTYSAFEKASQGVALLTQKMQQYESVVNQRTQGFTKTQTQLSQLESRLSHFSGLSEKNSAALGKFGERITILKDKLNVLNKAFRQGQLSENQYDNATNKLSRDVAKLDKEMQMMTRDLSLGNVALDKHGNVVSKNSAEYKNLDASARQSGRGITSFNNGVVQTAHSGRILSNTLYQIRGALLSLKMIFTAMGGMALWGFATDLATGVTETFKAKNEMEAQLRQNSRVDRGGIDYFNKELDELTHHFKKINKYSIGETVSSIGLEFNLNAKQMAESLDIVSMIQSEYVRAGRKEDEAALAVKDILQGEFQRLSRETGVGKEELKEYGWNGEKTDIDSLLKALRKAALDRHWDIFAAKATSLNDVMTITKSRFSETGADLMQSATPMIVGAFNTIIDSIDSLQRGFNGMSAFWQNFTLIGSGVGIFGGILTALPMITKGMGLAEIATLGWKKSMATAILNLNKAEVAQYGFRKALAATISGTKASELANTRWTKSIMGRLLGVNQSTLAEKGYLTAMVESRAVMKGTNATLAKLSANTMTRAQKLAYLTTNIDLNTAKSLKQGQAIRKVATSWKIWRMAILGVTAIGLVAWFSSVSAWCKQTKDDVDGFRKVVSQGDEMLSDAKKTVDDYTTSLSKLTKGTDSYKRVSANLDIAKGNVKDLEKANKLAKQYDYNIKQYGKSIQERKEIRLSDSLYRAGLSRTDATEKASGYADQVERGYEAELKAYQIEDKRLYLASQHINERVDSMKQENVELDKRLKYTREYSNAAESAAEHWKQFYKGNFNAALYAMGDELRLIWIDLWNNTAFVNFWKSVQKTWEELKPTAYAIKDALIGIGEALLNFFSTDAGRWIGTIGAVGTGIGLIGLKIGKWVTGSSSVFEVLKKVGGKLKDVAKGWKDVKDNAEDAIEKTGGSTPTTSTGGINGDVDKTKAKTPFKETLKSDAQNYARAAIGIAAGMALITEAIILLKAPMWGLAEVGKQFKAQEPEIQAGIEGLKMISPVLAVLLPAVVGLSLIMDKYAPSFTQIVSGTAKAALGIAAGMLLVAETIVMIIPSIWAIGALGDQFSGIQAQVQKGTQAMKIVSDSLMYLAPFIPALALAIATVAIAFANPILGAIMGAAITLGIPIGMLWVAETIWSLEYPLQQIGALGDKFTDLSNVQQGAEAIKLTAEALGYVEKAMSAFALIAWDSLATAVANLIGVKIGADLTQLTGEGGFFSQLETFITDFNKLEITQIDSAKVTTLSESATGIDSVKTALVTVKEALKDLPNFETDNRSPNEKYQDAVSGAATADTNGVTNYFEQLKQPIDQLNEFVKNFNENITVEPINPDKVAALQNSANGISAIQTAIDAVKNAMGSAVDASWQGNMASGGILGAAVGYLIGDGNPQASGLKSGLDELYMSVKDIMDFNTKINGLTTTQSGDTSNVANASNMVSALQTEINNLKTTLSGAVPTVKATAKDMGTAIVSGVKEGLTSLNSDVSSALSGLSDTMSSKGKGLGDNLSNGFKDNAKIKSTAETEVGYALTYLEERKQDFYDKGAALGTALSNGFKDNNGLDQHSPGKMARAVSDEMGYIGQALTNTGGLNLPQMASQLAQSLTTNFNPSFGLGNIQLPNLDQFKQSISTVLPTVTGMKTQVVTNFNAMKTGIQSSFTNIVAKTRSSLSNMKAATIGNIGNIKTSWRGMQDALIASADHIKTQTGQKINKLKTNLGEFWNKIKHPDQLIGSQGGHTGSIRRRFTGGRANGHYAGGTVSRSQSLFKGSKSRGQPSDNSMLEYLKCMMDTGKPCYAGGWNFNWTNKISKKFKGWNTHFGAYHLDDFLNVGKFENSNFPVKGRADVAKQYIFDVISATDYDKYFDSNFGDDPVAALRAGAFNCWDGTNIVLAIARAFGFEGSRGHGTWNGIGHVWANIPGLGIIDPTAIQNRGSFTSSAVKGYNAGSMPRRYASRNDELPNNGVVNNTTEVHIHGNVYGVDDLEKAIDDGVKKANRRLYGRRLSGV